MKEYLVVSDYGQWNNTWIVSAKNAKDAIELVYKSYIIPSNEYCKSENKKVGYHMYRMCRKDELRATSIKSLHKKEGEIILVN